jgi:hypothetical protein
VVALPTFQSVLVVSGINGQPMMSSYNASQDMGYIEAAKNNERDLNGNLIDLSRPEMQKYTTKISTNDVMFNIGMDGIWPGQQVTIDCIAQFVYAVGSSPSRPVVPGSDYVTPDGQFHSYAPRLTMLIDDFSIKYDEWGARVGWTLSASEV